MAKRPQPLTESLRRVIDLHFIMIKTAGQSEEALETAHRQHDEALVHGAESALEAKLTNHKTREAIARRWLLALGFTYEIVVRRAENDDWDEESELPDAQDAYHQLIILARDHLSRCADEPDDGEEEQRRRERILLEAERDLKGKVPPEVRKTALEYLADSTSDPEAEAKIRAILMDEYRRAGMPMPEWLRGPIAGEGDEGPKA